MHSWLLAIRPKTLIAAISPVLLGVVFCPHINTFLFFLTLSFALLIQIGTNLVNDYYDYLKGADKERKGPVRVCQAGLIAPQRVKYAFITCFILAFAIGFFVFTQKGGYFIPLMLFFSILLGIAYTAGPFPLGYIGLGDLAVFWFFGPLATLGTYYLQTKSVAWAPFTLGVAPGLVSCALLMVNNIRDMEEDQKASKKTLVVRLGKRFGKISYTIYLFIASLLPLLFVIFRLLPLYFSFLGIMFFYAFYLSHLLWKAKRAQDMNLLLMHTGRFLWIYTILFYAVDKISFFPFL